MCGGELDGCCLPASVFTSSSGGCCPKAQQKLPRQASSWPTGKSGNFCRYGTRVLGALHLVTGTEGPPEHPRGVSESGNGAGAAHNTPTVKALSNVFR